MSVKIKAAVLAAGLLPLCLAAPAVALEPQDVWGEGGLGAEETASPQNPSSQPGTGASQGEQVFNGLDEGGQHPVQAWAYDPGMGGYMPVGGSASSPKTYQLSDRDTLGWKLRLMAAMSQHAQQYFDQTLWQAFAQEFWGFGGDGNPSGNSQDPDVFDNDAVSGDAASGGGAQTGGSSGGSGYVCVTYNAMGACTAFGYFP